MIGVFDIVELDGRVCCCNMEVSDLIVRIVVNGVVGVDEVVLGICVVFLFLMCCSML